MRVHLPALFLLACNGPADDADGADRPVGCATDATAAAACVDGARFSADLEALAQPRSPGTPGWQAAQNLCIQVLEGAGFTVERHAYATGTNVIGRLEGTSASAEDVIVSAHYDSVSGCTGADDNASGVAGALEAARVLATGRWTHDLVVACWDEEERGLVGSDAWAREQKGAGATVRGMISLEMIAFRDDTPGSQTLPTGFDLLFPDAAATVASDGSRGDFIALVYDEGFPGADAFAGAVADLETVPVALTTDQATSPLLADLQRSDHASFWARGWPAAMVTDTADFRYGGYHCGDGDDVLSRLDTDFATQVVRATTASAAAMLVPSP